MKKMDIEKVKEYISEMYSLKPLYSNYFNQTLTLDDYFHKTTHTLLIAKPFIGYNRIYVLSDDLKEAAKELNALKGTNIINIPTKGDITHWELLMQKANFELIGVYERFYNTNICSKEEIGTIIYAEPTQEEEIYHLVYDSGFFSIYMDYLPSHEELKQLIQQKNVIINVTGSQIQGVLIFSINSQKLYSQVWIDKSNDGLKLLFDLFNIMVSKHVNYMYFWVNSKNKKNKTINMLLGAKPDGLKDYTFIKNSKNETANH
jgi:hypothetical protein